MESHGLYSNRAHKRVNPKFSWRRERPYAAASAGRYRELHHIPQSLRSAQMPSVRFARGLFISRANWRLIRTLPLLSSPYSSRFRADILFRAAPCHSDHAAMNIQ